MKKRIRQLSLPDGVWKTNRLRFADFDQPDDHGSQNDVHNDLNQEVDARKAEEHIRMGVFKAQRSAPFGDRFQEEDLTAQQEDAGIHHGTQNCRGIHCVRLSQIGRAHV